MAVNWKCDLCGKETFVNPPYKFKVDDAGNPIQTTTRQQNVYTGDVDSIAAYDLEYLQPKTYIVRLDMGGETIQKDFCEEHFLQIKHHLEALYGVLQNIKSQ
jgi:hypothetical protein